MNWFKLAGSFHTHPKLKRLQSQFPRRWRRAVTLWTMAASWCAQHEKDGVIELAMLPMFMSEPGDADMLVAVGFWESRSDESFQFHDWFDFQLTANQLRTSRERAIERAQKSRKSRIVAPHDALPDLIRSEISSVKREELNTSSLTPKTPEVGVRSVELAPASRELENIGYRWLFEMLGGNAPDLGSWRREYAQIGAKNPSERLLVARNALATVYIAEKRSKATPGHLVKFWDDFVAGPRNFEVKPLAKRFAGPSRVASAAEYAADAAGGNDPW